MLVLSVVLAGCAQGGGGGAAPGQDLGLDDIAPTATTGIIRGVVVDERIVPLAGANVTLKADPVQTVTSNENGGFGFAGLEPGTYFMEVSKAGFFPVQASADVVAGEEEPDITRVLLKANPVAKPFWQALVYEGYIQCTTSFLVLCGAPNVLTGDEITNDRFAWHQYFANNASLIQAEMVWDSTQALSPELFMEAESIHSDCDRKEGEQYEAYGSYHNNTSGVSPIFVTINQTRIDAWSVGETCPVFFSVFSGAITGTPCFDDVDPTGRLPGWCVGFTLQQKLTMFFHTFHGYLPPSGWRFSEQGDPPAPPE